MDKKSPEKQAGFLFNIEILVEGSSNGIALEKLTQLLNNGSVVDYKINSGIILGKIIDTTIEANQKELSFKKDLKKTQDSKEVKEVTKAIVPPDPENDNKQILNLIHYFKEHGTLLRLSVVKGKGVKLSMPCRILNYDSEMENVSIYHVDEKKVYLLKLNEIDDFIVN